MGKSTDGKRSTIGRKAITALVLYALVLTVAMTVPVSLGFSALSNRHYSETIRGYAKVIAGYIDGDNIAGYAETGETDDYYEKVTDYLFALKEGAELTDIYVYVLTDDGGMIIWDTASGPGETLLGEKLEGDETYYEYLAEGLKKEYEVFFVYPDGNRSVDSYVPLYDSSGEAVAVVCAERPAFDFKGAIKQYLYSIILVAACVSAVMTLIAYVFVKKRLIYPVKVLTDSVEDMVENIESDRQVSIDIDTNDELETLAEAFMKMDVDLKQYIDRLETATAEKERVEAELDLAARIQSSMLPNAFPPFPDKREFDLSATMEAAREVAGDFYDYLLVDDDHLALVIADVSGKGISAALFMAIARTLIKTQTEQGVQDPGEIFTRVNEKLREVNRESMFVTAWLGILELSTGKLMYVNAGHEYPAIQRAGGLFSIEEDVHCAPLASFKRATYKSGSFMLGPGDALYLYTDGVAEANITVEELFGYKRMLDALNKDPDADPETINANVKTAVSDFVKDAPQFDDITMLCLRFKGGRTNES